MSRSNQLAGLLTADPPSALDTINEINTALGNDASLSTTLTNSIATKAPIASPTFTGDAVFDTDTLKVDATNNRVGIGTTSPDALLTLDTNIGSASTGDIANFYASKGESDGARLIIQGTRHPTSSVRRIILDAKDGGNNAITLALQNSGGKVGIGTLTPEKLLHLHESTSSTIKFTNSTTGNGATDGVDIDVTGTSLTITNHEDGQFVYQQANGTDLLRVTTSAIDGVHLNAKVTKTSGNADTIYTPGMYRLDPAVSNKPTSSHHYAMVVFGNGSNVTTQLAVRIASQIAYIRSYNSSWTGWSQFN